MNILIGSGAIRHWFPDFPRDPKDMDYIGKGQNKKGIEYLDNPVFDYYLNPVLLPNDLYTLKISHLFWDINWSKHMFDVQWLQKKGCELDRKLFDRLYIYWQEVHGKNKRSDLKMTAEKFFDNALKKYDHDYLHTLLKLVPTYQKILKDGEQVEPDELKFNLLSFEDKLELVREEVYVMAYERLGDRNYREAYDWMLKKFIISHAPIWEALFIIKNFIPLHKPLINYKQIIDYELQRAS